MLLVILSSFQITREDRGIVSYSSFLLPSSSLTRTSSSIPSQQQREATYNRIARIMSFSPLVVLSLIAFAVLLGGTAKIIYLDLMGNRSGDEEVPEIAGEMWWVQLILILLYFTFTFFGFFTTLLSVHRMRYAGVLLTCVCGIYSVFYACLVMCDKLDRQLYYTTLQQNRAAATPSAVAADAAQQQNFQMADILAEVAQHGGAGEQLDAAGSCGGSSCSAKGSGVGLMFILEAVMSAFGTVGKMVLTSDMMRLPPDEMEKQFGNRVLANLRTPTMFYLNVVGLVIALVALREAVADVQREEAEEKIAAAASRLGSVAPEGEKKAELPRVSPSRKIPTAKKEHLKLNDREQIKREQNGRQTKTKTKKTYWGLLKHIIEADGIRSCDKLPASFYSQLDESSSGTLPNPSKAYSVYLGKGKTNLAVRLNRTENLSISSASPLQPVLFQTVTMRACAGAILFGRRPASINPSHAEQHSAALEPLNERIAFDQPFFPPHLTANATTAGPRSPALPLDGGSLATPAERRRDGHTTTTTATYQRSSTSGETESRPFPFKQRAAAWIHRPVTMRQLRSAVCGSDGLRLGECTVAMLEDGATPMSRVWCCGRIIWWRLVKEKLHGTTATTRTASGEGPWGKAAPDACDTALRQHKTLLVAVISDNTGAVGVLHAFPTRSSGAPPHGVALEDVGGMGLAEPLKSDDAALSTAGYRERHPGAALFEVNASGSDPNAEEDDVGSPRCCGIAPATTLQLDDTPYLDNLYVSFRGRLVMADAEPRLVRYFDDPAVQPLLCPAPAPPPSPPPFSAAAVSMPRRSLGEMVWLPGAGQAMPLDRLAEVYQEIGVMNPHPPGLNGTTCREQRTPHLLASCDTSADAEDDREKIAAAAPSRGPNFCLKGTLDVLDAHNELLFHHLSALHLHAAKGFLRLKGRKPPHGALLAFCCSFPSILNSSPLLVTSNLGHQVSVWAFVLHLLIFLTPSSAYIALHVTIAIIYSALCFPAIIISFFSFSLSLMIRTVFETIHCDWFRYSVDNGINGHRFPVFYVWVLIYFNARLLPLLFLFLFIISVVPAPPKKKTSTTTINIEGRMASNERLPNTLPATSPSSPVPTPAAKPTATAAPSLDKVAASLPALPSSVAGRSNSRTEEDGAAVATTAGSPLTPSPPPPVAKTSSSSNSSGLAPSAPITAPPQGYPATTGVSPRSAASFASSTASDTAAMRLHSPPAPSLAAGLAPAPPASGDAPLTAHLRQSSLSLSGTSHEARLEGLLAHKDAMISDLTGMVRRQESLLVEQDRIVQEQRATIAQKNEEIERLQKELDKMQQSLSKKQPNTPRWQRMKEAREDLIWLVTTDPAPDVAVVKYCVMNGADISYRLPLVNLPIFHYFAHEENVPCFQACMQTNEQIDFTSADDDGATVLHEAVRMNSLEKSKSILTAIFDCSSTCPDEGVDRYTVKRLNYNGISLSLSLSFIIIIIIIVITVIIFSGGCPWLPIITYLLSPLVVDINTNVYTAFPTSTRLYYFSPVCVCVSVCLPLSRSRSLSLSPSLYFLMQRGKASGLTPPLERDALRSQYWSSRRSTHQPHRHRGGHAAHHKDPRTSSKDVPFALTPATAAAAPGRKRPRDTFIADSHLYLSEEWGIGGAGAGTRFLDTADDLELAAQQEGVDVLLRVLRQTSLAEMRDEAMVQWLRETGRWFLRDILFRYEVDTSTPSYSYSLEQQDQAYTLAQLHFRLLGVLQTMPWWRLVDYSAIKDERGTPGNESAREGPYSLWLPTACRTEAHHPPHTSSLTACSDKGAPMSQARRMALEQWQYDVQVAFEQLCVVCLSHSIHTLKGVMEVLLKPFVLRSPARDGVPRRIPADSIIRVLSQIAKQQQEQQQQSGDGAAGVVPPLFGARVPSAVEGTLTAKVMKDLLEQCVDKWMPRPKWPDIWQHVASTAIFMHLALEDTVPSLVVQPNAVAAGKGIGADDHHRSMTKDDEAEKDEVASFQQKEGAGSPEAQGKGDTDNAKALNVAFQLVDAMMSSSGVSRSVPSGAVFYRELSLLLFPAAGARTATTRAGDTQQSGTRPNHMRPHGQTILGLLWKRFQMMELSLERRQPSAPVFTLLKPATSSTSSGATPSSVSPASSPAFPAPATAALEESCAINGPLSTCFLADIFGRGIPTDEGQAEEQETPPVDTLLEVQNDRLQQRHHCRWEAARRCGSSAIPSSVYKCFTESSKGTIEVLEASGAVLYARLAADMLRDALAADKHSSREELAGLRFPDWWQQLLSMHFDRLRGTNGPVCLTYLMPALLRLYGTACSVPLPLSSSPDDPDTAAPQAIKDDAKTKESVAEEDQEAAAVAADRQAKRQRLYAEEAINILHRLVSLVLKGYYMPQPAVLRTGSRGITSSLSHTSAAAATVTALTASAMGNPSAATVSPVVAGATTPPPSPGGPVAIRRALPPPSRGSGSASHSMMMMAGSTPHLSISERIRLAHHLFPMFQFFDLHLVHRDQDEQRRGGAPQCSAYAAVPLVASKTAAEVLLRRLIKWCRLLIPKELPGQNASAASVGSPLFSHPESRGFPAIGGASSGAVGGGQANVGPPELAAVVWAQSMAIARLMDNAMTSAAATSGESGGAAAPVWSMMPAIWADKSLLPLLQRFQLPQESPVDAEEGHTTEDKGATPIPLPGLDFERMEAEGLLRLVGDKGGWVIRAEVHGSLPGLPVGAMR
eukprot:gene10567-7337_t